MGLNEGKILKHELEDSVQINYLDQIKLLDSPKTLKKLTLVHKFPEYSNILLNPSTFL